MSLGIKRKGKVWDFQCKAGAWDLITEWILQDISVGLAWLVVRGIHLGMILITMCCEIAGIRSFGFLAGFAGAHGFASMYL